VGILCVVLGPASFGAGTIMLTNILLVACVSILFAVAISSISYILVDRLDMNLAKNQSNGRKAHVSDSISAKFILREIIK
jgi:hypothetical protein